MLARSLPSSSASGSASPVQSAGVCVQTVAAAGAAGEARRVLLAALAVLVLAALVVIWQRSALHVVHLHEYQLDMARDLNVAEQGAYADLQVVYDEWHHAGQSLPPPLPQEWAADGWPPFDAARTGRALWQWQRLAGADGRYAYFGWPVRVDGAAVDSSWAAASPSAPVRPFLWLLSAQEADDAPHFDLWLYPAHLDASDVQQADFLAAHLPQQWQVQSLVQHGWRQVIAHLRDVSSAADAHAGHGHAR